MKRITKIFGIVAVLLLTLLPASAQEAVEQLVTVEAPTAACLSEEEDASLCDAPTTTCSEATTADNLKNAGDDISTRVSKFFSDMGVVKLLTEDALDDATKAEYEKKSYSVPEPVEGWKFAIMLVVACILLYVAIAKKKEPLLLLPIAFGMLLTNLPGAGMFHAEMWNSEFLNPDSPFYHSYKHILAEGGLLDVLYIGVKTGIYPCLIFLGVGAMTDFGPLIANPKSLLLGAAAQIGIFATFLVMQFDVFDFTAKQAASIGIIGGADGPTAIFLTTRLAPELLAPIAVAAYSYMALVPVIQPPIMRALTTKKEREIRMKQLRTVSKREKILFPILVAAIVSLILPSAATLIGCLMLGNLMKESGVVERLSKTVQNELNNIVVIFLGTTVGATATAGAFLNFQTLSILAVGIVAFGFGSAGGVLLAKFMNLFLKEKINPLIGSAGVSAVPMAARVSQEQGQKADPRNFLLMHAMGPNVAGVIGSAVAAGILLSLLG